MTRKSALEREIEAYRAELGGVSFTALAAKLRMSRQAFQKIVDRGYCTPRIAKRLSQRSGGRLPAWLLLGLRAPPRHDDRDPEAPRLRAG